MATTGYGTVSLSEAMALSAKLKAKLDSLSESEIIGQLPPLPQGVTIKADRVRGEYGYICVIIPKSSPMTIWDFIRAEPYQSFILAAYKVGFSLWRVSKDGRSHSGDMVELVPPWISPWD
jgi:hypothetical protein